MFCTDDQPSRLRKRMPIVQPVALLDVLLIIPSSTVAGYATGYPDVQLDRELDALLYNDRHSVLEHIRMMLGPPALYVEPQRVSLIMCTYN
jgi:glutamate synthase domain-containing protein 1